MLKTVLLVSLSCAIALGGGVASLLYALDRTEGFDAVAIGPWITHPTFGTPDADPYARARYSRSDQLGLGRGEGMAFRARTDSAGAPLRGGCTYLVSGTTPPGRFWTLYATDAGGAALPAVKRRRPATQSQAILREPDGSFTVAFGPEPLPGNWMPMPSEPAADFQLALTIYDTPLAGSQDIPAAALPGIRRASCRG